MDFFINDFIALWSELASLLLDWGMVGVDLEPVYCYFRVDSGHFFVIPSEEIMVLLKELDECKAEFRAEACSNLDLVVWVIGMNADIVEFVYAQLIQLQMLSRGRL